MYESIYDHDPRKFYSITADQESVKSRIKQKGIRERLLCHDCETIINRYETHAAENIYGKNQNAQAELTHKSRIEEARVVVYHFRNFDYDLMKLFLDSLLWRLIVSAGFPTPEYPEAITEQLRLSLLNSKPLEPDQFPCGLQAVLTGENTLLKGSILGPNIKGNPDREVLSILIDGLEYNFYVRGDLPNDPVNTFLKRNGNMKIIGRLIYDMPASIEMIKRGMEHLDEREENKKV